MKFTERLRLAARFVLNVSSPSSGPPTIPTPPAIPTGGLTGEEQAVMDGLVLAWNNYILLDYETGGPSDAERREFEQAIHAAQRILGCRALARLYPHYWRD